MIRKKTKFKFSIKTNHYRNVLASIKNNSFGTKYVKRYPENENKKQS